MLGFIATEQEIARKRQKVIPVDMIGLAAAGGPSQGRRGHAQGFVSRARTGV